MLFCNARYRTVPAPVLWTLEFIFLFMHAARMCLSYLQGAGLTSSSLRQQKTALPVRALCSSDSEKDGRMSDNPLEDTPEREARIRTRAYHLWEADGCPHGQDAEYWERARELVGMEASPDAALLPNPATLGGPDRVTVEEASIQENLGEFPDRLADQGEWRQFPMTKHELHEWEEGKTQPLRNDAP
jgi:hypothetical protein